MSVAGTEPRVTPALGHNKSIVMPDSKFPLMTPNSHLGARFDASDWAIGHEAIPIDTHVETVAGGTI